VVKVIDGSAEFKRGRGGSGAGNAAVGFAVARADAPSGRETDADGGADWEETAEATAP
jgi:hypothetical protein